MTNQIIITAVAFWLLSSLAHALPTPRENDSRLYVFAYNFAHLLCANWGMLGRVAPLLLCLLLLPVAHAQHAMQPDAKLTPGATDPHVTQENIKTTVCKSGYTKTVRDVTEAEKKEVMKRYGLPESDLHLVEIDHFFSLELAGSNDVTNLWPQYYRTDKDPASYLGAREKDVVETALKRAVCSGKMTLVEAQDAIRTWPEAYRKLKGEK